MNRMVQVSITRRVNLKIPITELRGDTLSLTVDEARDLANQILNALVAMKKD